MADSVTKSQVIRITEMTVASTKIENRQFEDCLILGPAVVAFSGDNHLDNCSFEGPLDALLWEIPPERPQVIGVVEVADCSFVKCRFQGVGFAGAKEFVDQFIANTPEVP